MSKCQVKNLLNRVLKSCWAVGAVAVAGVAAGQNVMADTTVTSTASVTVEASCTLTGTVDTPHSATLANGTYSADSEDYSGGIGKTTIKTFCNDPSGYALYAIGYTDDTYGTTTLKGATTGNTINTGVYSSGATTSSWSMKLNAVDGTYKPTVESPFTAYAAVPSNFTKVASFGNSTDVEVSGSGVGSSVQTTYAAFISGTQAADTYTGQVKYVLVHPNTTVAGLYNIAYDPNGGTGTTTGHTGVYNFEPVTLAASGFTREGFDFAGWCTTNTSQTSCLDGTLYQPGAEATSLGSAGSTATLYAIWGGTTFDEAFAAAGKSKTDGYYVMQDAENSICDAVTTGQSTTLLDIRGSKETYTVAKLKDKKCWMTKNLNLAGGTALSSSDTNVTSDYISNFTTGYNLTKNGGTIVLPASATAGFNNDSNAFVYNSNSETCGASSPCYSYYSWPAATLGSGRTISTDNTDAEQSICPSGWRLPTSGADSNNGWKRGDFYTLATAYGANLESNYYENSSTFYNNAGPGTTPGFLLAGYYLGGSFSSGGSGGGYWSATSDSNSSYARYLSFNSSGVYSAGGGHRRLGFSVRCIFGS